MMNILPFLHFFAFLNYSCLLVFLLWKDSKSLLNRVCAALLACFMVWSFGSIFICNPSTTKDSVRLFDNVGSLGWISFASFFLWFALIFTEKKKILKARMIYPLIFIPPLLLHYQQWTGFLTADYIKELWGWQNVWSGSIWTFLFYLYYLSFMIIGLYLILNFERKTEELIKKRQAGIIFVTALISLLFSTLTDVILPELKVLLPSLGNVITLIWASGMVYAIAKYRLMIITPVTAAEKIISTMADSLILLDRQGNIAVVNKATLGLSGYVESELEGKSIEMLFTEKDFKNNLLDKAIKKEAIRNYELDFKTKTGNHIPVVFSSSTMMDETGGMVGIVCIIKDITERKKTEEAIRKSQQELDSLFRRAPEAMVYLDEKGTILDANLRFCELFGYSLTEIKGRKIYEGIIHPLNKIEEGKRLSVDALKGYLNYETIRKKKDGTLFPVSLSTTPLVIDGQSKGAIGIYIDISLRTKLQNTLQESEEKFRNITEGSADAIFITDQQGNYVYINQAATSLLGYSLSEITRMNIRDISPPKEIKEGIRVFQGVLKKRKLFQEMDLVRKNGSVVPVDLNTVLLPNGFVFGSCRDITKRKRTEEALQKIRKEFTGLFQSSPEATIHLDKNGNIININNRFSELFGYTLDEIKGEKIDTGLILPPDKIKESKELTEKALKRGFVSFETIRKKKDGTLFPVHVSYSPLFIDGKNQGTIGVYGVYQDITERKQIEEKLEKMARIDSLTGCYNRRYGLELLDRQMKLSHRSKSPLLLAFLDIDKFKFINDTLGHDEGDQVLKEAVNLFKSTLREIDIICRMGGDEFLLIFPDSSLKDAAQIQERLNKNLIELNQTRKKPYQIEISMGLSEYDPEKPLSRDELIRIADQKMYEEKKSKKKE